MSKDRKPTSRAKSKSPLSQIAGQVHTYDSFGRAIVAAALKQAENSTGINVTNTASVTVAALDPPTMVLSGGLAASGTGGHAKGTVVTPPAFSLTICFGGDCHTLRL